MSDSAITARAHSDLGLNAFATTGFALPRFRQILAGSCVATGVLYVGATWASGGDLAITGAFIGIMVCANLFLIYGLGMMFRFFRHDSLPFFSALCLANGGDVSTKHEQFCTLVMNVQRMFLCGSIYGTVATVYYLGWGVPSTSYVAGTLFSLFFFLTHFITGSGIYSLFNFVRFSYRTGWEIPINLWQIDNPTTKFLLKANRRAGFVAATYVCLAMSSLVFSQTVLKVQGAVVYYAVFSGLVVVLSIVVPSLPVALRIQEEKSNTLSDLDERIDVEFRSTLESLRTGNPTADTKKFECLLQLRDKITSIDAWPFKLKSVAALISVVLLTALPIVIKELVSNVL